MKKLLLILFSIMLFACEKEEVVIPEEEDTSITVSIGAAPDPVTISNGRTSSGPLEFIIVECMIFKYTGYDSYNDIYNTEVFYDETFSIYDGDEIPETIQNINLPEAGYYRIWMEYRLKDENNKYYTFRTDEKNIYLDNDIRYEPSVDPVTHQLVNELVNNQNDYSIRLSFYLDSYMEKDPNRVAWINNEDINYRHYSTTSYNETNDYVQHKGFSYRKFQHCNYINIQIVERDTYNVIAEYNHNVDVTFEPAIRYHFRYDVASFLNASNGRISSDAIQIIKSPIN